MVREDSDAIADRKIRQHTVRSRPYRDDAMLLISVGDDQIVVGVANDIADHAIALVHALLGGATILRHRHPPGIDQDPALLTLVADHGRQHREGNVFDPADPYTGHHQ